MLDSLLGWLLLYSRLTREVLIERISPFPDALQHFRRLKVIGHVLYVLGKFFYFDFVRCFAYRLRAPIITPQFTEC